jgi:hypothetical protein
MIRRNLIQVNKIGWKKIFPGKAIILFTLPAILFLIAVSCQQAKKTESEQAAAPVVHEFTGKVKMAWGKYLYLPAAQGFDIVVEGNLESGTITDLIDKEVRIKGNMMAEEPSLFIADSIEIKEGENQWRTIFTRTSEVKLTDFFDPDERGNYVALNITNINKPADWEGKEKAKIYGKFIQGQSPADNRIVIYDAKGKELARIIVDNITDYALYYLKKLRLYDKFWFYLKVKDTVDARTRAKTKEIFHADVVFAGLY